MNRVDLAVAEHYGIEGETRAYVQACGRRARRNERLSAEFAASIQRMPIRQRIIGWRRTGEPRGRTFGSWSTMREEAFRHQLHLAARRGSETAARQLSMAFTEEVVR